MPFGTYNLTFLGIVVLETEFRIISSLFIFEIYFHIVYYEYIGVYADPSADRIRLNWYGYGRI